MKTLSRNFIPGILLNPISRNLIFILFGGLLGAVALVTLAFILIG